MAEALPMTATTTNDRNAQFAALKARYPKVKDSIVFAIHALQLNLDIALDDLKAQADLHGILVTASTVTATQRLLAQTSATNGAKASPAPQGNRREAAAHAATSLDSGPAGRRGPGP